MPHVELIGISDLTAFHSSFAPRAMEETGRILKANACYISSDQHTVLVECLVVEGYLRQSFFILITLRDGRVMVRLLPRTSPEKTLGVKRCVVWIARWLQNGLSPAMVGATNLADVLQEPFPSDFASP
jgi:hypothetical protein